MSDRYVSVTEDADGDLRIKTKPCWICGQHSYVTVPYNVWRLFDLHDIHLDTAWPDGPAETKQLIRTGVHEACWDAEFPDTPQPAEASEPTTAAPTTSHDKEN